MFEGGEYLRRGLRFLNNKMHPKKKTLSSLMIYATDVCDSACKHCLIWAKRPANYLSLDVIKQIMKSECIRKSTMVGLEGGEFLLHPDANVILEWFNRNHPNFDLFSNCLKPDALIEAVRMHRPKRLYISLDGSRETYNFMRGKDGHPDVIRVIDTLSEEIPIFVMFTLSPYNDMDDLKHVAEICKQKGVFLRVGIYNNISFFDTIEDARVVEFGQHKNQAVLTFKEAKKSKESSIPFTDTWNEKRSDFVQSIPDAVKDFPENYDYIRLYDNWVRGSMRLKCHSIMDSLIILPDGTVPICQFKDLKLGNIFESNLDVIFNSENSVKHQQFHSENCNQCWISYHRKYDVALYRTFEKYFGKWTTTKLLGYYKWESSDNVSYKDAIA